jgi:nitrogen fixation-related uncharacterized protein
MDALIILAAIFVGLVGFDVAALRWGVDSRDSYGDDHTR